MAFAEAGSEQVALPLQEIDVLLSSNLLEAELRSAIRREKVQADPSELLASISWVHPDRPLTEEFTLVLDNGYVRLKGKQANAYSVSPSGRSAIRNDAARL